MKHAIKKKRFLQVIKNAKKDFVSRVQIEERILSKKERKLKMANHTSHHRKPKKNHKWRSSIFSKDKKRIEELRLKFASNEICGRFEYTPKIFDFDLAVY